MKIRFYISILSILFGFLGSISDGAAELRIDSVYPTMGIVGQEMDISVKGAEFNEIKSIYSYLDTGNRHAILGSLNLPVSGVNKVKVVDNLAYLAASNNGLYIINVSNPNSPFIMGSVDTPGVSSDVAVSGNLVFIADGESGVQIIDASDPRKPFIINTVHTIRYSWEVDVVGNILYSSGSISNGGKLEIIDVSNPLKPIAIGNVDTPGPAWGGLSVVGDKAYLGDYDYGLEIFDLSIPSKPLRIASMSLPPGGTAADLIVYGKKVYMASGNTGLKIIDVTNPYMPSVIGSVNTYLGSLFTAPYGIALTNNTIFISQMGSVKVIDISNISEPKIIGSIAVPGRLKGITSVGNTVYVTNENGLYIIDGTSDLMESPVIGFMGSMKGCYCYAYDIQIIGNKAFIAHTSDGLKIIDVSNPYSPKLISSVKMPDKADRMFIDGNKIYIGCVKAGLVIVDITDIYKPIIIGSLDTPTYARGIVVKENIAYVADSDSVQVIDIRDPIHPTKIGYVQTPGENIDLAISENILYLAAGSKGLQIIDIGVPTKPVIIGSIDTPGWANDVVVKDNTVYIADGSAGLQIIDVTTPSAPKIISQLIAQWYARNLSMLENTIYIAEELAGVTIIDVSDRLNPKTIAKIPTLDDAYSVVSAGDKIYVADLNIDMTILPAPIKIPNYTVNSEAKISFHLPSPQIPGHYDLRILSNNDDKEFRGAFTFVPPEDSYLLDTKAIIVVGTKSDDSIKQNTAQAGAQAYKTLLYQGYTAESIYYLAPDMSEGVDAKATKDNISFAINIWAKQNPTATELLIYLVDHGEPEGFHINETETLTAQELSQWLNDLQNNLNIPVTLVYDACRSGSFLSKLSPPPVGKERIVMTSTLPTQDAVIGYNLSFSYYFWDGIFNGKELGNAFEYARNNGPIQHTPQIDANGNGKGNEPEDFAIAKSRKLRRGYKPQTDVPYIYDVSAPQVIHNETSATLKAGVSCVKDGTAVRRVWAVITPPDFFPDAPNTPITDLPTVELTDTDNDGMYEGIYDKFLKNGVYDIQICAMNTQGAYALFRRTTVSKAGNYISGMTPPKELYGADTSALLWASLMPNIEIRRVWAEIIPPVIGAPAETVELEKDGIYQAVYDKFSYYGTYTVNFYATDTEGYTTPANRTTVTRLGYTDADKSENDNTFDLARLYDKQRISHNFHEPGDADWVKFSAIAGKNYTVRTKNQSLSCDTVIGVYKLSGGKLLMLTDPINKNSAGQGESYDLTFAEKGIYYVKVSNANPQVFGNNVSYDLEIYQPVAGVTGTIRGTITDTRGKAVADAMISTSGGSAVSMENGAFSTEHPTGTYTITVEADGYQIYEISVTVLENQTLTKNIVLTPIHIYKGDVNGDGKLDLADVILVLRVMSGINDASQSVRSEADTNGDSRIGLEEAVYILQKVAGLR